MNNMEYEKLVNIAKYPTGKLNSNQMVADGEFPFFTCAHEVYRIDRYSYDGEYVLLGGNNATGNFPIFYYNGKFDAYQRTYLIQPKDDKYLTKYLYYCIGLRLKQMQSNASGTATKYLTLPILNKLNIEKRTKDAQQKIVNILSSYDELIDINNKRIKLLEQIAEEIYKEWFTRYRFNGYENLEIIDGIPNDWNRVSLNEFGIFLITGSRPSGGIDSSIEEGIPSLGAESIKELAEFDYNSVRLIPFEYYANMKNGKNTNDDILLYKDGAYIGKITRFKNGFPFSNYAINEHVFFVNAKNINYQNYLYFTLHQPKYFTLMQNLNRNAAQPGLSKKDIERIKILLPPEEIVCRFNKLIDPIMNQIFALAQKNKNLIDQRTLLLPRLMSGKLEIK